MTGRQAREAERRRAARSRARHDRAEKVRRERRIVAIVLVIGLVLALAATGLVLTNQSAADGAVPPADAAAWNHGVFGTVVQGLETLRSVGAVGIDTGATDGRPATDVIIEKAVIS
ncbi:peptidylprolyl isomerase [Serinibacter arcticus]|uniref:Uncharacterized protein n=1 Tax=Serinibacter arcticus TaxID=1655435 RepID=A0A4Z1E0Y7_9MICO|nr:hypothetical protein [Serinibacter arcticus]TGO04748.1 hypothetical protein SERN_2341 [Serinibacter arcticus]